MILCSQSGNWLHKTNWLHRSSLSALPAVQWGVNVAECKTMSGHTCAGHAAISWSVARDSSAGEAGVQEQTPAQRGALLPETARGVCPTHIPTPQAGNIKATMHEAVSMQPQYHQHMRLLDDRM